MQLGAPDVRSWTRRRERSVLTGSCAALAWVLGLPVTSVRAAFLLGSSLAIPAVPMLGAWDEYAAAGTVAFTIGGPFLIGYLALWWALPLDRESDRRGALVPSAAAVRGRPATSSPTMPEPTRQLPRWLALAAVVGLALIVAAAAVLLPLGGAILGNTNVYASSLTGYRGLAIAASGILAAGLALGVLPLEAVDRARWGGSIRTMPRLVLAALGTALALLVLGVLWLAALLLGTAAAVLTALVSLAVISLLAIVVVPWGRHLWVGMREEAEERARVQQRSEITAHLHDSVLQTLTLLQQPGTDPEAVRVLARRQERELRRWLYRDAADADPSSDVREAVLALCAEVEDDHGVDVQVVVIGDAALTERMRPLLRALRESTVNACRHGKVGVDVFVDVASDQIEAFVRDRGPGFDLADVPADRLGVRESIIGRMTRAGGGAAVHRAPGGGTEVALTLPIDHRRP